MDAVRARWQSGGMAELPALEVVSWARVDALIGRLARRIEAAGLRPDRIVAIARGGLVPARLLADRLGVMRMACIRLEHYRGMDKQPMAALAEPFPVPVAGERVLLVDDLSDTGESFRLAAAHLAAQGASELRTAALHCKPGAVFEPDFLAARLRRWRWIAYPWARWEDLAALAARLGGNDPVAAAAALSRLGLRVTAEELAAARGAWNMR